MVIDEMLLDFSNAVQEIEISCQTIITSSPIMLNLNESEHLLLYAHV